MDTSSPHIAPVPSATQVAIGDEIAFLILGRELVPGVIRVARADLPYTAILLTSRIDPAELAEALDVGARPGGTDRRFRRQSRAAPRLRRRPPGSSRPGGREAALRSDRAPPGRASVPSLAGRTCRIRRFSASRTLATRRSKRTLLRIPKPSSNTPSSAARLARVGNSNCLLTSIYYGGVISPVRTCAANAVPLGSTPMRPARNAVGLTLWKKRSSIIFGAAGRMENCTSHRAGFWSARNAIASCVT